VANVYLVGDKMAKSRLSTDGYKEYIEWIEDTFNFDWEDVTDMRDYEEKVKKVFDYNHTLSGEIVTKSIFKGYVGDKLEYGDDTTDASFKNNKPPKYTYKVTETWDRVNQGIHEDMENQKKKLEFNLDLSKRNADIYKLAELETEIHDENKDILPSDLTDREIGKMKDDITLTPKVVRFDRLVSNIDMGTASDAKINEIKQKGTDELRKLNEEVAKRKDLLEKGDFYKGFYAKGARKKFPSFLSDKELEIASDLGKEKWKPTLSQKSTQIYLEHLGYNEPEAKQYAKALRTAWIKSGRRLSTEQMNIKYVKDMERRAIEDRRREREEKKLARSEADEYRDLIKKMRSVK